MGRQIVFVHSEVDTEHFLQRLNEYQARIFVNGELCDPKAACQYITEKMTKGCADYYIAPSEFCVENLPHWCKEEYSRLIEFPNSFMYNRRPGLLCYETGRLYIQKNDEGNYFEDTVKLFNKLRRFISKEYIYCKPFFYVGPDFWAKYQDGICLASHNRLLLDLHKAGENSREPEH